jgi:uncharacterized protein, YhcH/YjgK/YiaL family
MIVDVLANSEAIESLHPLFKQAFDFLKSTDFANREPGKIFLDGEKLFVSISEPDGKIKEAAKLETHKDHIDIQMPIIGKETIGWLPASNCKNEAIPYNPETDTTFFADKPTTYIDLNPSEFAIFFPEDGHAPAIANGKIKKAIVKILI